MALTQNYLSKSSDGVDLDHLTDSIIYDDGTNVGIGTNSPSCKLDIKGYSSYPAVIVGPVNNYNGIIDCKTQNDNRVAAFRCIRTAGTYATTWEIRTPENSKSLAFYNGGDKVTITDGGNVGIGTTSPSGTVHIYSSGAYGTQLRIQNTSAGGRHWNIYSSGASSTIGAGKLSIKDETSGVERFVMDSSGRVGIGLPNSDPSSMLDVYGDIEIDNGAWNGGHLKMGSYHLWIDSSGRLRIKSSAPTSDTDGTVVGTQS